MGWHKWLATLVADVQGDRPGRWKVVSHRMWSVDRHMSTAEVYGGQRAGTRAQVQQDFE